MKLLNQPDNMMHRLPFLEQKAQAESQRGGGRALGFVIVLLLTSLLSLTRDDLTVFSVFSSDQILVV